MSVEEIRKIIHSLPELPSMPNIVAFALEVIRDPNSSAKKLGSVIANDPAITTEVIKVVNSAYYGLSQQITTVSHSVTLLGFNEIRNIILSCALKPMLTSHGGKAIWEHSIRAAIGCEVLSRSLGRSDADECFAFGLLHDVGKIIFELYNKSSVQEVSRLVSYGANVFAAEKMLFGFDHSEAGEELVIRWRLPKIIRHVVKHHHTPQLSEYANTVGIVYAADRIVQDQLTYPILAPEIMARLDFDIEDPTPLREEILEKAERLIKALMKD